MGSQSSSNSDNPTNSSDSANSTDPPRLSRSNSDEVIKIKDNKDKKHKSKPKKPKRKRPKSDTPTPRPYKHPVVSVVLFCSCHKQDGIDKVDIKFLPIYAIPSHLRPGYENNNCHERVHVHTFVNSQWVVARIHNGQDQIKEMNIWDQFMALIGHSREYMTPDLETLRTLCKDDPGDFIVFKRASDLNIINGHEIIITSKFFSREIWDFGTKL